MSIWLGNIMFDQVEDKLGFKLTEEDRKLWNKYHISSADLSGKDIGFHVFDIPRCIHIKGEEMKDIIMKMFSPDKIVKEVGSIQVYISE